MALVVLGLTLYASLHLPDNAAHLFQIGALLSFAISTGGVAFALSYKGYDDPKSRQQCYFELKNKQITALNFIQKHGWENIRRWGFFIPTDQKPICTKELLAKRIRQEIMQDMHSYCCTQKNHLATLHNRHFGYYTYFSLYLDHYRPTAPVLWDAIEHKTFTQEQLEEIFKKFESEVQTFKGHELLANWPYIKQADFNKSLKFTKLCNWLESNQEKYEQLQQLYFEQANAIFKQIDVATEYLFKINKQDKESDFSKRLREGLPEFKQGFFLTLNSHIENLKLLNHWFAEHLAEFDKEFLNMLNS